MLLLWIRRRTELMIITYKENALKIALLLFTLVVTFSAVLYFIDARELVQSIGVRNSYLLLFFIALIGGVSSFTTGSYLATLFLFAQEGLSVWLLGLAGGLAIFIGDIIFFYLGQYGFKALQDSNSEWASKFRSWMNQRSLISLQLFTYFYVGLTPLPNDIITIALGASEYKFRNFLIPLFIGSIQLQTLAAYFFSLGMFEWLAR